VNFRYFQDELLFLLETFLQSYFLTKYNATYAEYFYGYARKDISSSPITMKKKKLLVLIFTTFLPYLRKKMEQVYWFY